MNKFQAAQSYRNMLQPWAQLYKFAELKQMTFLELDTVVRINPFYLMGTFGVSYDACRKLADILQLSLPADTEAYVFVERLLMERQVLPVDVAHDLLAISEIKGNTAVDNAWPYGVQLDKHPLAHLNPDNASVVEMCAALTIRENKVSAIRERTFLRNRIVVFRGNYVLRGRVGAWTDELDAIAKRAARVQKHLLNSA